MSLIGDFTVTLCYSSLVGRLCEYTESQEASNIRDTCGSIESYLGVVTSGEPICEEGNSSTFEEGNSTTFTWTPDEDTPDVVYYQVYMYMYSYTRG